jgi:hypothetical protein
MIGQPDREPAGISGDCFFVLAMHYRDGGLTAVELQQAIEAENTALGCAFPTVIQVRNNLLNTLAARRRPLVRRVPGHRWEITGHGWAMLDYWVGADEPEPVSPLRRVSGLGWPPLPGAA